MYDFDLIVIGAGSGGVRAARMAASAGARVAIFEERFFGGTCVNIGCVPKKLMVYASQFRGQFEAASAYGWQSGNLVFDWPTLIANKNREIERLNGIYRTLLEKAGVHIEASRAEFIDPHTVASGERQWSARHLLIATGSEAVKPDIPGAEFGVISDAMFYLDKLPQQCVILGGGYIAVEFAGILAELGVETHLVYRGPQLLKRFDQDLREGLQAALRARRVQLHLEQNVRAVHDQDGQCSGVTLSDGSRLDCDLLLFATGRRPRSSGLGLERAGVRVRDNGAIEVDEDYRTSAGHIHAVGDVIDRAQLTPVALAEGMYVARKLFGGASAQAVDYDRIPTAVFSQPPLATVGPTEEEARRRFPALQVFRSSFRPLFETLTGNEEKTIVKLLVDGDTDQVVAAHMLGPECAEIMQGLAVAIRAGATKKDFDTTLGIHPTVAEEFVTLREPAGK